MGVPDTSKWGSRPGNFDRLNLETRFPEEPRFGLPIIHGVHQLQPEQMLGWVQRAKLLRGDPAAVAEGCWHFYTDDYRFEPLWNKPDKYLDTVGQALAAVTPDFSVYRDWPLAAQLWNTYRSRWLGALWEAQGVSVVPCMNWGSYLTYEFCFASVQPGATVSVSSVGVRDPQGWQLFRAGYEAMVETIQPSLVLVYGERWDDALTGLCPVARYAPNGVLEMRARLEHAVDRRQLKMFDIWEKEDDDGQAGDPGDAPGAQGAEQGQAGERQRPERAPADAAPDDRGPGAEKG